MTAFSLFGRRRVKSVMSRAPVAAVVAAAMVAGGATFATTRLGAEQAEQQPTFRVGVDVIELDVSVLDRDRRPVRGLSANDFTLTEDGRPQRIVTVSQVDLTTHDPVRSARMRFVPRDVAANDLGDQLGDGRLVAIVFDDVNLPADDPDIVRAARETARYVVDQLGPSDLAAVVHAQNSGRTQDFTDDRTKLLAAIDRFLPVTMGYIAPTPSGVGQGGGDMVQRWSPALMRSACMRGEPAVPTLDAVASRMATAPGRRKALVFLSVGVPLSLLGGGSCASQLNDVMRDVFRKAQRANLNIYSIDPAGRDGYRDYLIRNVAPRGQDLPPGFRRRATNVRQLEDFMKVIATTTGGRAVVNTNAIESAIDEIFEEDRAYYLIGYESSNGAPDGKFRKVDIRVNRPGMSVRSRNGYWAPSADEVVARPAPGAPSSTDVSMVGMTGPQALPLRAVVVPIGRSSPAPGDRNVDVSMTVSVKFPPLRFAADDTLTVIRNVYDAESRPGPPVRETLSVRLEPNRGDEVRHEFSQRLSLAPGRYQIRFNTQSALLQANGSVYADVEVPDLTRPALSLSGLLLGHGTNGSPRTDALEGHVPIVPTSARDFAAGDDLSAFVRVYQGEAADLAPVTVLTEVLDSSDVVKHTATQVLDPAAFDAGRGAPLEVAVPLSALGPGPYLLSVTARLPGGRSARRELILRIR